MRLAKLALVTAAAFTILAGFAIAQEKATLTSPITVTKTTTEYEVWGVAVARKPDWSIVISYGDNMGNEYADSHSGVDAAALVKALNTANLSLKSLERRAMEHLISEGKIPGSTITGVPQ